MLENKCSLKDTDKWTNTKHTHKKKKTFQVDYKKIVVLKLRSLILGIISDQEVQTNPVIFMFRL